MKKTIISDDELLKQKQLQETKNNESLKRFILEQTESLVKDKFSDKELDAENEKRRLLSSIEDIWKVKHLDNQILREPSDYKVIFKQEYYQQIYRLNSWPYENPISHKKWKVGRYTNEIIYYRFSNEVLPLLRIINPYILPGIRKNKHHQHLTTESRMNLEIFINQAIDLMIECNDWNEFRIKYCTKYNVPYQLRLF
ncbi:P63C domain-containing protein [Flavobacterium sp.]|uniref:P63C domain-containing protein n=1 Tax=Flavobacterium sp. TaxID=239 RepID=UPI00261C14CF|nr:P63C domain-containing protein [Flavobacterium sp.]MDD2985536.1 P63C domain-containing protein [Flavobacterium sp.]